MSSNFERLQKCSRRQLGAFISSIVSKRASEFVDWNAWLASDDPDVTFIGEDALYKEEDGSERECRFLEELKDDDGMVCRRIFFFEEDGDVTPRTVRADLVRKLSEDAYPVFSETASPLSPFFTRPEPQPEAAAPAAEPVQEVQEAPEEIGLPDGIDLDDMILSEINEAADMTEQAESEITGRITVQEEEEAAQALEDKPFTDLQNIDIDAEDDELPSLISEPDSTDFLDYQPQLEEYDQALESIENTMQMELTDVPLDEEDEPIGELLQTLKERSALYDPNDQEDHELPTIAFTAIAEDKLVNNE